MGKKLMSRLLLACYWIILGNAFSVCVPVYAQGSDVQSGYRSSTPSAPTKIRLCNKSSTTVSTAFAYFDKSVNKWHSKGWYNLEINECTTRVIPNIDNLAYSGQVFYYAESTDGGHWGDLSNGKICVDTKYSFDIVRSLENLCQGSGLGWKPVNVIYTTQSGTVKKDLGN
jgi:uncharacterized membrane protein